MHHQTQPLALFEALQEQCNPIRESVFLCSDRLRKHTTFTTITVVMSNYSKFSLPDVILTHQEDDIVERGKKAEQNKTQQIQNKAQ